jgi:hypothetical protein
MERSRLYNVYPLLYNGYNSIYDDLDRIADLEFNGVWLNPMFETSSEPSPLNGKKNSPYGHASFRLDARYRQNEDQSMHDDAQQITQYTDSCRDLGLRSFMDVVLLHVAHDHPLVTNQHDGFKDCEILQKIPDHIDTSRWFLNESNAMGDDVWDDVRPFNFEDPDVRREVLDYYLKPYIEYVIKDFGFDALRIDSAPYIMPEVYHELMEYADQVCHDRHGKPAQFFPETVGQMPFEDIAALEDHADLCYSSAHWFFIGKLAQWNIDGMNHSVDILNPAMASKTMMTSDEKMRSILQTYADELHDDYGYLSASVGQLKDEVAPVCGFVDNHDTIVATDVFNRMGLSHEQTAQLSRLTMGIMAFLHDGWFLTKGSEHLKSSNSVFHASADDIDTCIDNSDFVRQVNQTLAALPDIRKEWCQAHFDPDSPEVLYIVLRGGEGFDNTPDVIAVNISDGPATLRQADLDKAIQSTVDRHGHPDVHDVSNEHNVYVCGDISVGPTLQQTHNVVVNGKLIGDESDSGYSSSLLVGQSSPDDPSTLNL